MFTHEEIWNRIDDLAFQFHLSPSGLAKKAGLDPTSFNKSKRISNDGRARWPSTESIAKVMRCLDISAVDFFGGELPTEKNVVHEKTALPLVGFARAGQGGYPEAHDWDEIEFPSNTAAKQIALTVQGDSMLPLYREGDILIVEPDAKIVPGDRVVVRTTEGEVLAKSLLKISDRNFILGSMNNAYENLTVARKTIDWLARIVWVSQ